MQNKRGISLMVLVITIIVMIILVGAIILTLNNTGVIDKATDAVEQTNLATVKELTEMAWSDAYAKGIRTEQELKEAVYKNLEDNKVDLSKYTIKVTTKGADIELKGPWKQDGLTVTNGELVLKVGDSIAYDETKGGTITGLTSTDWKLLGANDEGELLIMSVKQVCKYQMGDMTSDEKLKETQNAWLNGEKIINGLCEPYGKGIGAIGARSLSVEDIDRITGYDKTTYYPEELYGYGNEVTYTYNGTIYPSYIATNGLTGNLTNSNHKNGFWFYDGEKFVEVEEVDKGKVGETFAKAKSDLYIYNASYYLEPTSKASLMLLGNYNEETGAYGNWYWLAEPCTLPLTGTINYGHRILASGQVTYNHLWSATGATSSFSRGVCPVVILSRYVKVSGSSNDGWTISME